MFGSVRVIAGSFRNLGATVLLNVLHFILKGFPFGMLILILHELLRPEEEIRGMYLFWLVFIIAWVMLINVFLAIHVHLRAYVTAYGLATEARLRLADHLRGLSLGFFKKRDPGDISSLMLQDMTKVETLFSHFFMDAIACVVLPLFMASFLGFVDGRMTLFMLVFVLLALPALMAAQKIIGYFGKRHMQTRNAVASRMLEYLQGIRVLMAFNQTGKNFLRLDAMMQRFRKDSIRLEAAGGGPVMVYCLILEAGFVGLLVLGAFLYGAGELGLSVFLIFLVIGYKFFEPWINFGLFLSEMRYMNIAARRITEVMDTPPLQEPEKPLFPEGRDIVFEKVDFSYGERRVLHGVSARFGAGEVTALVGPSGGGKTTLTSLIARFWDVGGGRITIGGADIRDIPVEKLHALLSVVFQDVYLFQDTLMNNIRVGRRSATDEEVRDAARKARCHDFIMALEEGYDTLAGEGGARLSGGERQRISIARALLKDAPIVLLDEATASLDPENELCIQQAISELVRSKTLIVIAHRLKTISQADRIYVLNKGRIVEEGRHGDLLEADGLYADLWREQQRSGGWKLKGGSLALAG